MHVGSNPPMTGPGPQAIDGGGKDSTTRHVFSAFNPQGCTVTSFKAPTVEELRHDYLWRVHQHAPAHGEIGVFNRSHYEDVLVVRVDSLVPKETWKARYEQINEFESLLAAANTSIVKIFLHISKDEQKRRFPFPVPNGWFVVAEAKDLAAGEVMPA